MSEWNTNYRGPDLNPPERPDLGTLASLMFSYEDGAHVCACAFLGANAPCGHCTDCPVCNCRTCDDWHDTAGGETCPMKEDQP